MNLVCMLIVCFIGIAVAQDCELEVEIDKVVTLFIETFAAKEHHKTYKGCCRSVIYGKPELCDQKNFNFPQVPICTECIKHAHFGARVKQHSIKGYKGLIENGGYSAGIDMDDLCTNMFKDGSKAIFDMKDAMNGGSGKAAQMFEKYKKAKPDEYNKMSKLPDEAVEYMSGYSDCFKELTKIIRVTSKQKGMASLNALDSGIQTMVGGGDFGIKTSKCINELIKWITKSVNDIKAG